MERRGNTEKALMQKLEAQEKVMAENAVELQELKDESKSRENDAKHLHAYIDTVNSKVA